MKKGMKKHYLDGKTCRETFNEIDSRLVSGATGLKGINESWDGLDFTEFTFFAVPEELQKIINEISNRYQVKITLFN